MKIKYIIWILCWTFSSNIFAEGSKVENKVPDNTVEEVADLSNWLVGQMISAETMMVYFNINQAAFQEYITSNGVETLDIELVKKNTAGDVLHSLGYVSITDLMTFNVTSWSYPIENVDQANWQYFARIQHETSEIKCELLFLIPLVEETPIVEDEVELPISLPEYECGETYTYENITNQSPLVAATSGDVFFIGGMPVLIDQITGGNGSYSGSGIIPVPFSNKTVRVEFTDIAVNDERVVYQGNMVAIADDPANYPDFNPDTGPLNIGGDICLPPPPAPGYNSDGVDPVTGLNSWGFDPETGLNSETGTEYDSNGFDINGAHVSTGTPYNEHGCNRDGVTATGEPCDPSGGTNPQAEAYAEEHADDLRAQIATLALGIQTELYDELNNLNCIGIKTQMEVLIATLGFDRNFIFGENDRYVNEDMHLAFEEAPKSMVLNANRDENVILLEEKHIQLFHCDKTRFKLNALYIAISALITGNDLSGPIISSISNWSSYQYTLYTSDPEKLEMWLLAQIGDLMWSASNLSDDYAVVDDEKSSPTTTLPTNILNAAFEINNNSNRYYNMTASADDAFFVDSDRISLAELAFYFRQGDQSINGVDRAFYLEELDRQQSLATFDGEENLLPLKIEKTVGNKTYTIYLDGIEFTPNGAILDAYIIITDPETGKKLVFRALDVGFGPTGLQSESRLHLATDIEIRLSNAAMLVLKGTADTYVAWDCDGFSSMGVDAEIEFCRNFIIPLDPSTLAPLPEDERYRLAISVQGISSWLEFYLVVNAPPFAVAEYPDVKWSLTNMILDFSSEETPQFTPLAGYESPYWNDQEMSPLWKGFFVENLTATLPNTFGSGDEPIVASAFNILIDGTGFSGGVAVDNILSIEEGNMAGWPISIEDFELRILNNQFAGAGIGGQMKVPVFEEAMGYEAVMYPGNNISFVVSPPTTGLTMDMFLADVELDANSEITIGKVDGEFVAVANLNGSMIVNTGGANNAAISLGIPDITFQGFQVSNQAPYFSPGTWGLGGGFGIELGFNGFGLSLSNIQPYDAGNQKAGVSFEMGINLVDALGISAAGSFGIEGELIEENGQQRWVYERVKVNAIHIDASFPSTEIEGILQWYGNSGTPDPVWGEGFRGMLKAKFKGFDIELSAATQFGKKDDYKYFFVDALADLGAGIGTGAIQLKGFGGGVSYKMDISQTDVNLLNTSGSILPPLGATFSGTVYTPNPDARLGLKATALITTAKEEIFNGTVSLVFNFNANNGLDNMSILGSGQFLQDLNFDILPDFVPDALSPPSSTDGKLTAFINLEFNFSEPSFHGNLNVFLNAGPVRGAGVGGKMVDAELHFDATQWYIYIGRPEEGQRCGIIFEVPNIGALSTTAYFDIGTNVPSMPDLPQNVREIAYLVSPNTSLRNSGAGFAFGASLNFEISARIASIVSADLAAGAGFDMMLKKYDDLSCGDIDPVGIDGWYASGQMWAYVSGDLKVFGVSVLSAGLAAVLQARLPNPFFAQATVGVRFKILFKTVTKSLKLELGDDCILTSGNPNNEVGMEVITLLEPFEGAEGVETSARPKAIFALELNKNFDMPDLNGNTHNFEVTLASTSLVSSQGYNISHTVEMSEQGGFLTVIPTATMPVEDEVSFEVTVNINKNGSFLAAETKSIVFKTGQDLDYIPEVNVSATYPVNGMLNFYENEYNAHKGYIKLITGQANLLLNLPFAQEQKVKFTAANGTTHYVDYTYNVSTRVLSFPMDPTRFNSGELYKMEIIRRSTINDVIGPVNTGGLLEGALNTQIERAPEGNQNDSDGGIDPHPVLYTLLFRVSEYETFAEKIEAIMSNGNDNEMKIDLANYETFDVVEMEGLNNYDPLVQFKANVNTPWMDEVNQAFILVETFVNATEVTVDDLENEVGLLALDYSLILRETDFLAGDFNNNLPQHLAYKLYDSAIALYDSAMDAPSNGNGLTGVQIQWCADHPSDPDCHHLSVFVEGLVAGVPELTSGNYPVTVNYKLPDGPVTTNRSIVFVKE